MIDEQRVEGGGRQPGDTPAAWFVVLEHARQINDPELARRARRELDRLGVRVTYKQPPTPEAVSQGVARD